MLKKLLCILLSCVLLSTIGVTAYAENISKQNPNQSVKTINQQSIKSTMQSEEFWQLVNVYILDTECHNYSKDDLMNSYFSELFQIPQVTHNGDIIFNDSIWHCILKNNNQAVAIINFVVKDSNVFYTISEAYTNKINLTNSNTVQMYFYDNSFCCNSVCISENRSIVNNINNVNLAEKNVDSQNVSQLLTEYLGTRSVSNITGGKILSNYPTFSQGSTPLCWAGTIASMVKYEYPTTYSNITINDVCAAINCYTGATWDQIVDALEYYFSSPYSVDTVESYLSKSQIKTAIGNNDPALMSSLNSAGTSAHITALTGYQENGSTMRIKIMNSGTGYQEWGNYCSTAPYTYQYNNDTYTWDKSIRLLYN